MRTLIIILILSINFSVFAQKNERSIFLFGTDSLKITEVDSGEYKKYTIANIKNNTTKKSFTVYNDETPQFSSRFITTYDSLDNEPYKFPSKSYTDLSNEARIVYIRLRNMENSSRLGSKKSIRPEAGLLAIKADVEVQQVDPRLKKQIKAILKQKTGNFPDNAPVTFVFFSNNCSIDTVEFTKGNGKWYKYKEVKRSGSVTSNEYYKKKKHLKQRFLTLIIDSINCQERMKILKFDSLITVNERKFVFDSIKLSDYRRRMLHIKGELDKTEAKINTINASAKNNFNTKIISVVDSLMRIYSNTQAGLSAINEIFVALKDTSVSNDKLIQYENNFKQPINKQLAKYNDTISGINDSIIYLKNKINSVKQNNSNADKTNANNLKIATLISIKNRDKLIKDIYTDSLTVLSKLKNTITNLVSQKLQYNYLRVNYTPQKAELKSLKTSLSRKLKYFKDTVNYYSESVQTNKNRISQWKNQKSLLLNNLMIQPMRIDSLQIEFNDGAIENIQVIGKLKNTGEILKFSNLRPFGFTSKSDFDRLNKRWLFSDNSNGKIFSLNVGKLIKDYYEKLSVDRRDYSPKNQVLIVKRTDKTSNDKEFKKIVYKEYSNEIVTGTVYTDLNGISGNEPNGLIQTEFYKELAIIKRRFSLKNPLYSTSKINLNVKRKRDFNYGILSYVTPHFVLSKIEKTNKYLSLSKKEVVYNGITDTIYYASTMDLRKYESFRVGLKANVLLLDFPSAKTSFYIDYRFYWGRIPVNKFSNESSAEFQANSIEHGPIVSVEFFTDERYGLRISGGYNWYYVLNDQFTQVGDDRTFAFTNEYIDKTNGKSGYWNAQFLAFLKPDRDGKGKIFFRYNYFAPSGHGDLSWSQIQLGYAFSITKTEKPVIKE